MGINHRLLPPSHRSSLRSRKTTQVLPFSPLSDWSYIKWFDEKNIEEKPCPPPSKHHVSRKQKEKTYDILQQEMWQEYYRPSTISSIQKIFSYNMNSPLRNFHPKFSPFPPHTTDFI